MPALSKLSIQAPLPLTLLETLLLPDLDVFNRIEMLVDISLVIQVSQICLVRVVGSTLLTKTLPPSSRTDDALGRP